MMEDVQKYTSRESTRNMRVVKPGTASEPVWPADSFILGDIGFALPFTIARPFSCTVFAGILIKNDYVGMEFSQTVTRRTKKGAMLSSMIEGHFYQSQQDSQLTAMFESCSK